MVFRPIPAISEESARLFWAQVRMAGMGECWEWQGSQGESHGHCYGVWSYQRQSYKAHRIAHTLAIGPIPEGLTIDHVKARGCTSKLCCNPAHLEAVTQSVNVGRNKRNVCACGASRDSGCKNRCRPCHNAYFRAYRLCKIVKCKDIARASYQRIGKQTRKVRDSKISPMRSHDFIL